MKWLEKWGQRCDYFDRVIVKCFLEMVIIGAVLFIPSACACLYDAGHHLVKFLLKKGRS